MDLGSGLICRRNFLFYTKSMEGYFLTAESVTPGHPDKLADFIADTVLDAILEQDKYG